MSAPVRLKAASMGQIVSTLSAATSRRSFSAMDAGWLAILILDDPTVGVDIVRR